MGKFLKLLISGSFCLFGVSLILAGWLSSMNTEHGKDLLALGGLIIFLIGLGSLTFNYKSSRLQKTI